MNILITGAAGYIGSHCAINFINNNYNIIIFDNLETGHIEIIEELKKLANIKFIKGDLRNKSDVENLFKENKIDAVVHFAAYSLVEESVKNPSKYYNNNVVGTLNLIDSMVKYNVKKIVFSSTCATYGEPKYTPLDENHPQNPINPYGSTKLVIEYMLKDYDKAYNLKSIKLRYFNVAGCDEKSRTGEWHDIETHLIPNILKSTFENDGNKKFKIFGNDYNTPDGTCVRDYVNVEDLVEAHRLALEYLIKENKSDAFNLGTQKGNSVREVFDTCQKVLNKKIDVEIAQRREGDPEILYSNSQKAHKILNWHPKKTIEYSIKTAYEWECKLREILAERSG